MPSSSKQLECVCLCVAKNSLLLHSHLRQARSSTLRALAHHCSGTFSSSWIRIKNNSRLSRRNKSNKRARSLSSCHLLHPSRALGSIARCCLLLARKLGPTGSTLRQSREVSLLSLSRDNISPASQAATLPLSFPRPQPPINRCFLLGLPTSRRRAAQRAPSTQHQAPSTKCRARVAPRAQAPESGPLAEAGSPFGPGSLRTLHCRGRPHPAHYPPKVR